MSYSERAYFDGDHCQHCAARDEHQRLQRARRQMEQADRRRLPRYNAEAVQAQINKDRRIGGREAKLIHAVLKGRS